MDITQLIGVIGVPGALCFVILKSFNDLRNTIERNTEVIYLLAGKMGVKNEELKPDS
ncbi:hypothetical protein SAMN05444162_2548 [Paenibacillaceae bacterium GAS479]|nr:hypothetical protein SAMN05444162_2548 [Paenibacillaceae bacterium GAS479]